MLVTDACGRAKIIRCTDYLIFFVILRLTNRARNYQTMTANGNQSSPDTTGQKQDTRFKPGQSGNPAGRPKGSRNRVSEKLLEALAIDFENHGREVIETVRAERPADYLKIVASLVPKQMEIDDL